jgi:hypothetical protein
MPTSGEYVGVIRKEWWSKKPRMMSCIVSSSVFSTAVELRGADLPFFSCRKTYFFILAGEGAIIDTNCALKQLMLMRHPVVR